MIPGSLTGLLNRARPETPLWCVPGQEPKCAADIQQFVQANHRLLAPLRGRNVAVWADTDFELVSLLVLLDGICRQVTLLPDTMPPGQLSTIIERSQSDLVVTSGKIAPVAGTCEAVTWNVHALWNSRAEEPQFDRSDVMSSRWVLPTSGTTGDPKLVSHTLLSLTRTAKHDMEKGREYRWGSLYNLTGFAGLQVFLQSWFGGSCLILGQRDLRISDRITELASCHCSALSATPTMWRKLLMSDVASHLRLRQITLGGEIADQNVLDALRLAFPTAKISHIYASTEAGVGFAVRDGRAGFPATFLNKPPHGVTIAVSDRGHLLLMSDHDEQAYLARDLSLKRPDGFIDTGDHVQLHGQRYVFLGRTGGIINVGGNKVYPEEVEKVLLACEGVRFARVRGRPNPIAGSVVQAEVLRNEEVNTTADEFRRFLINRCRQQLEAFKVPAVVRFVENIELTNSGKLKRED